MTLLVSGHSSLNGPDESLRGKGKGAWSALLRQRLNSLMLFEDVGEMQLQAGAAMSAAAAQPQPQHSAGAPAQGVPKPELPDKSMCLGLRV